MQTALDKFTLHIQKLMWTPVQGGAGMRAAVYKCRNNAILVHDKPIDFTFTSRQSKTPASVDQLIDLDHKYEFSSWVR